MVRQYHNLGGASEIPILNRQAQPDTSALGMTEWTVLARIDGKRSIEALVKLLPLDESRVIESLLRLKALGMIEVGVKREQLRGEPMQAQ